MIDAIRMTGGALVLALYMSTKRRQDDPAAMERERKRLLDNHVLYSVLG